MEVCDVRIGSAAVALSALTCSAVLAGCVQNAGAPDGSCGLKQAHEFSEGDDRSGYASEEGYVGRSLAAAMGLAEQRGVDLRVVGEDGDCADANDDFSPRRVNAYIEDGAVSMVAVF